MVVFSGGDGVHAFGVADEAEVLPGAADAVGPVERERVRTCTAGSSSGSTLIATLYAATAANRCPTPQPATTIHSRERSDWFSSVRSSTRVIAVRAVIARP
jgi:hypothetical protein